MNEPTPLPRRHLRSASAPTTERTDLGELLRSVARSDESAFARLFDEMGSSVYGLVRRVLRDPSRSEEVTQEVFLQIWQNAHRFDDARGKPRSWMLTLAHRRAVDAVRHDQAATNRDLKYDWTGGPAYDQVEEEVSTRLEHEQVRRCMNGLTQLQREAVNLAYYKGHTYAEVADLLQANPATIKTRMRDGLIRLRDCMGVSA